MTEIEIRGHVPRFPRIEIESWLRRCQKAIDRVAPPGSGRFDLSIALVDDETMRPLNREFRGKTGTTDILTFPPAEPGPAQPPVAELVISLDQARRQALDEKHSLATEIRYLLLHGLLHARGYDHETDDGTMNEIEVGLRKRLQLE